MLSHKESWAKCHCISLMNSLGERSKVTWSLYKVDGMRHSLLVGCAIEVLSTVLLSLSSMLGSIYHTTNAPKHFVRFHCRQFEIRYGTNLKRTLYRQQITHQFVPWRWDKTHLKRPRWGSQNGRLLKIERFHVRERVFRYLVRSRCLPCKQVLTFCGLGCMIHVSRIPWPSSRCLLFSSNLF